MYLITQISANPDTLTSRPLSKQFTGLTIAATADGKLSDPHKS